MVHYGLGSSDAVTKVQLPQTCNCQALSSSGKALQNILINVDKHPELRKQLCTVSNILQLCTFGELPTESVCVLALRSSTDETSQQLPCGISCTSLAHEPIPFIVPCELTAVKGFSVVYHLSGNRGDSELQDWWLRAYGDCLSQDTASWTCHAEL